MVARETLHVVFFPLLAYGHMLPLYDVARLFAPRGVKVTFITTPVNSVVFPKFDNINLEIIPFPSEKVGLPAGFDNLENVTGNDVLVKFVDGVRLLALPLESLLKRLQPRPICLVSDLFLSWTTDVAEWFGIPRVSFHGGSYFGMAVFDAMMNHKPHIGVKSEDEEFVVPRVPGDVRLTKRKMSPTSKGVADEAGQSAATKMMNGAFEAEKKSFGVIMNSFEELEPLHADHYRKVMGRRTWSVGPVSLCNRFVARRRNLKKVVRIQATIDYEGIDGRLRLQIGGM